VAGGLTEDRVMIEIRIILLIKAYSQSLENKICTVSLTSKRHFLTKLFYFRLASGNFALSETSEPKRGMPSPNTVFGPNLKEKLMRYCNGARQAC
jgi:hypothetical protein